MSESETPIQQAQRIAAENRAKGIKPKKAHEILSRKKDNDKFNTYLPRKLIADLKQRALDENKSVSALLTEAATSTWSLNDPVRRPRKREYPTIDLT
ncbi:ParB-like dsDNA partitioning protein [Mycobacterium phage Gail]|uniref:ParB-like dsDNA partitioning protein n=1 Tax=Mycobacterium phage Gail TaxID=2743994 RepID=A0A7D5FMJ0_9CAUD|nr:Arc-like repressor [Mycobacterium phage Gail]QLF84603.1 ParB-like dsDNA partitioning protein [Mycobacterium phage Gail]